MKVINPTIQRSTMRVLVACEFSGMVRNAFLVCGHDAWSCDLLPALRPPYDRHLRCDVTPVLRDRWDLIVAHPPCTYLCASGSRWQRDEGRMERTIAAAGFFRECLNANAHYVCVENPVMHGYARRLVARRYTQIIQPYMFGHGQTKATCLWLRRLPYLRATRIVSGRKPVVHHMSGRDRGLRRSITLAGVACAMASQWGSLQVSSS